MRKIIFYFAVGLFLIGSNLYAQDVSISSDGNVTTGSSNSYGNLKVIGASGEHGVFGESRGTGAAGIYGKNTDSNNYGILGNDNYGVYGNSGSGYAGYFEGNARVTGNLTVVGTLTGETDPTVNASVKDGVDWTELSGVPFGFADGIDNTGGSDFWTAGGSDIYFNSGNVGIGTSLPAGKLDVNGDICLGGICRTSWPTGSGSGAFTDTGIAAYYNSGNVGIGTSTPVSLGSTDTRVLHIKQPVALLDHAVAGLRLEVENNVNGGITSAYNHITGEGGVFVGALTNHRLGFITNSMEKMSLDPNGSLGIGTTSPLQLLHVQGTAYVSGNLGVGVGSPDNNLQVNGTNALFSSGTGDFRLTLSKKTETDNASLIFQTDFIEFAEIGLAGNNDLHIKVSPDGANFSEAMIINHHNGNIVIGDSNTESAKLMVRTIDDFTAIQAITEDSWRTVDILQMGWGDGLRITNSSATGAGIALLVEHYGTGPAMIVKNKTANLMSVNSNGYVGIGTNTPKSHLQVNGYIQLALTSGAPPAADCNESTERGRMKVDNAAGVLYICMDPGWVSK